MSDHAKGLLITALGVLILTPDSLLIRMIAIDQWSTIFWRGSLMSVGLLAYVIWSERKNTLQAFVNIGWVGIGVALLFCVNSFTFVFAIQNTSVANTLVIIAVSPMFAALMSRMFLSERVPLRTIVAMIATFAGIAIIVWESLIISSGSTIYGDIAAFGTAILLAATFVMIRKARTINMIPATALGAAFAPIIVLGLGLGGPTMLPLEKFGLIALMGLFVLPLSFGMITIGPRYIPAPEVGLLLLLETVLGPIWVWLVIHEDISSTTLIGGSIVVIALALNSALALRKTVSE